MTERYTVISADCHGGGNMGDYRPYLDARYLDHFDAWLAEFENPYDDLRNTDASRNWDHDRRLAEMEADGVVAEVIFPNTIPPFFPQPSLLNQPPPATAGDLDQRWAGLHAHNRWLADFCAAAPGRRAGIAQILLHDVGRAVQEVRWAKEHGLTGGVLLPGAPPGSGLPPLYAPDYEPLWTVCEELGMPVNHHSGSATPDYGPYPAAQAVFLVEVTWWAHRTLWHLIYSGVLERHPDLQLVFTEQGTAWLPEQLRTLDDYYLRMRAATGSQEAIYGADVMAELSLKPSEYWARQCHVGSSFIRQHEVPLRDQVGVDKIMWGSDFPHREGCWPYSVQHLRLAFAGVDPGEVQAMVGGNAARLYGFDLEQLAPIAARVGPRVDEVAQPLPVDEIPREALRCPAFAAAAAAGGSPSLWQRSERHPDSSAARTTGTRVRYGARTPGELSNREVQATSVGAWSTSLTASYLTDPEVIAAVLPPPLEPTDEPLVRVSVARVDLGRGLPPFGAGTVAVQARHDGTVGNYPLVMPMTTEQSVIGGRETFGEPKKLAQVTLDRDGDRVTGRVTRLGITFVELAGTVSDTLDVPDDLDRVDFYFKFLPAPDGKGFDAEPSLVYCHRHETYRSLARVDGRVTLTDSRFDPVADLPVRQLVSMTLSERRAEQRGEIVTRVPGEWLAPYVHQRYDDLSPVGED